MKTNQNKIISVIKSKSEEIESIDESLMMDVVGVTHALDDLRKALDKVDKCLDDREFSQAAQLGYSDVSSGFIFLQRVLGALQDSVHQSQSLTSQIAVEAKSNSFEETWPYVKEKLQSMQPRKKLSMQEKKKSEEKLKKILKKFGCEEP